MKTRFSVLVSSASIGFESQVEEFLKDKTLVSANFQRNLFYPRKGREFYDDLQETYTAFILWEVPKKESEETPYRIAQEVTKRLKEKKR